MLKAYKFRLYPTKKQAEILEKHFNCCRFIYNAALETKEQTYKSSYEHEKGKRVNLSSYDLTKQLTELKKEPYFSFLKEIDSQSLNLAIADMDAAYQNFFKHGRGFPKFKSKAKSRAAFSLSQGIKINVENNTFSFSKVKGIKIVLHRPIEGTMKQNATISKTKTNKYFISVLAETNQVCKPKKDIQFETTLGIDLGIKDFLVTSNGDRIENPKYLRKAESHLKYLQRLYSKHGGKRTKIKLAKAHEKVKNKREDFLHQVSSKLIKENDTIATETLKVKNMVKNHHLAKSISDASWGTFNNMLKYKGDWDGTNILSIGTFEPSSKTCNVCGTKNEHLMLKHRYWTCSNCNTEHDRDINAAINIKNIALKNINNIK